MYRKDCFKFHQFFAIHFLNPRRLLVHAPQRALELASATLLASIAANQHQSRVSKSFALRHLHMIMVMDF